MTRKTKDADLTRRDFVKTVGLAGLAVAGSGVTGALAAPEAPAPAAKASTVPKRQLGKTGVEVSSLCLGGMFDTINNQLLLKQALKWGVTYWDTAEAYGIRPERGGLRPLLRPQPRGPQRDLPGHQAPAQGRQLQRAPG